MTNNKKIIVIIAFVIVFFRFIGLFNGYKVYEGDYLGDTITLKVKKTLGKDYKAVVIERENSKEYKYKGKLSYSHDVKGDRLYRSYFAPSVADEWDYDPEEDAFYAKHIVNGSGQYYLITLKRK